MRAAPPPLVPDSPLARLLAPIGLESFVRDRLGKEPVLLHGDPARIRGLLTLERLEQAVVNRQQEQGRFLVHPAGLDNLDAVRAYVDAHQPIVWNAARGASSLLDSLANELAATLGAHVWVNVYSTAAGSKPFDVHFDAHDVLAVQCEGVKEWMVSTVRVNCPLDVPALAPTIRRALDARRAEALAKPLMTVVTNPGDVLYIPRGQFHDARTPEGRSLHVTFAIAPPTGIDVLEALMPLALREALFREYLPIALADVDGSRTRAHLGVLAKRLTELLSADDVLAALDARK